MLVIFIIFLESQTLLFYTKRVVSKNIKSYAIKASYLSYHIFALKTAHHSLTPHT